MNIINILNDNIRIIILNTLVFGGILLFFYEYFYKKLKNENKKLIYRNNKLQKDYSDLIDDGIVGKIVEKMSVLERIRFASSCMILPVDYVKALTSNKNLKFNVNRDMSYMINKYNDIANSISEFYIDNTDIFGSVGKESTDDVVKQSYHIKRLAKEGSYVGTVSGVGYDFIKNKAIFKELSEINEEERLTYSLH